MSLIRWQLCVLGLGCLIFNACSRGSGSGASLKLQVPRHLTSTQGKVGSKTVSAQSAVEQLAFAALNVQLPGSSAPVVYEFEFDDEDGSAGTGDVVLELEDVPVGSALVQFIGVYENGSTGMMVFRYGDKQHVIVDGDNQVSIVATVMGVSTEEHTAAGRYYSTATGGPTGQLIMHVHPPNGKPKMNIHKVEVFNGWFEIFHPGGGVSMSYSDATTGETVFGPFTETDPFFAGTDTNTQVAKFTVPSYFSPRDGGEAKPSTVFTVGYFKKEGVSPSGFASKQVCYLSQDESVANAFADAALSSVLEWRSASGSATVMRKTSGGGSVDFPASSYDIFYNNAACSSTSGVRFHHDKVEERGEDVVGRRGPFRVVQQGKRYGGYLGAYLVDSSGLAMKLHWDYWDGAEDNLGGIKILAKYSSNSGGNDGGGDRDCQNLVDKEGYVEVADLPTSATDHVFSGGSGGAPTLTTSNYYNYRFAVCPYFANGKLAESYIEASCFGGCIEPSSGRKIPGAGAGHDYTVVAGPDVSQISDSALKGAYGRVISMTRQVDNSLELSLGETRNFSTFQPGDDVMLSVMSDLGSSCSASPFPDVSVGMKAVARVVDTIGTPDRIYIPSGTFLDGINTADLNAVADNTTNHCYVMVTRIVEFGNLSLNITRTLYADPFEPESLLAGGVLALRVSGALNMNDDSSLSANFRGYPGGNPGSGAGIEGPVPASGTSYTGGTADISTGGGGGGGAYSPGGDSDSTTAGGDNATHWQSNYSNIGLGGGGGSGESGTNAGGDGGGSIYLVANKIDAVGAMSGTRKISANGKAGGSGTNGGGGGGGAGTVNIYVRSLANTSAQGIQVEAIGGNGGVATSKGGVGGGGAIYMNYCSSQVSTSDYSVDVSMGGVGSSTNSGNGNLFVNTSDHFCEE